MHKKYLPAYYLIIFFSYLTAEDYDKIVFLYQLERGKAGGSYGLNVAALAGLEPAILRAAGRKSRELQAKTLAGQTGLAPSEERTDGSRNGEDVDAFLRVMEALQGSEDISPQLLREAVGGARESLV